MTDWNFGAATADAKARAALAGTHSADPVILLRTIADAVNSLQADVAFAVTPEALRSFALAAELPSPEHWRSLLRHSLRWCADPEALEALLDACERAAKFPVQYIPLLAGGRRRIAFRRDLARRHLDNIPVVSLGTLCLGFELPMRFGFGVRLGGHTLFTPFSLAVHKLDFVLKAIETNWDGYAADEQLMLLRSANGLLCVARRDGAAVWNHHIGEHWAVDSFAPFKASIQTACSTFDDLFMRNDLSLAVFVLCFQPGLHLERHGAYLERMLRALDQRSSGLRPHILAISTPRETSTLSFDTFGPVRLASRITALEMPIPRPDYIWYEDQHNNSPDGLVFDFAIAEAMAAEIERWQENSGINGIPSKAG